MSKQRIRRAGLAMGLWALAVGAGVVGLTGCGGSSNNNGGSGVTPNSIITIGPGASHLDMAAFSPASDTVHVGNIVRMQNNDSITHQINATTLGGPTWGTISAGRNADFTANAVGTWPYKCFVVGHVMNGELVIIP